MFDVGFWEISLIALVALLVIGPERLPKVARVAGLWIGRGRRMIGSVKADIEREIKAGGEVPLKGLGKFKVQNRKARVGRNPLTGEPVDIPAKTVVKFTVAKSLKDTHR